MKPNLIEPMKQYMADNNVTQSELAAMVGVAPSTFSRWLNESLSNPEAQDEKARSFLDKAAKRRKTQTRSDIAYAETSICKKIVGVLDYCRIQRTIGCIYGDAGIGKTLTIKRWSGGKPDVVYLFASKPFSGEKPFMKLLAQSLRTHADGSIDEIFSGVCAKLEKSDITIIIDEAERLPLGTLENIRDLNELTATPIVLVGNATVYSRIKGSKKPEFAQFFSRINPRLPLLTSDFTIADMRTIFPETSSGIQEYLLSIAQSRYGLRGAASVFINGLNNDAATEGDFRTMARGVGITL